MRPQPTPAEPDVAPAPPIAATDMPAASTAVGRSVTDEVKAARADVGAPYADQAATQEATRKLLDRVQARKELEGKFDIVDDDHRGERKPNTVTRTEFNALVRRYSDIRLGDSSLKIDTANMSAEEAKRFKDGTLNDLSTIMQTPSGRELVQRLAEQKKGHTTTISQRREDKKNDTCDEDPRGRPTDEPDVDPLHGESRNWSNGRGTDARVRYWPGMLTTLPGDPATRSDVVLYHELTHAMHITNGTMDMSKVGPEGPAADRVTLPASCGAPAQRLSRFEHQAAGLGRYRDAAISENRYRAERRQMAGAVGSQADDADMPDRPSYVQP